MSMLENVLGGLMGNNAATGNNPMLDVVGQLINHAGGLQGLVGMLTQGGLGQQAGSWISSGANLPVSADQLTQALGSGQVGAMLQQAAQRMGMSHGDLMGQLSQILPHAVDHLTPNGQIGQGGVDLSGLAGLAGQLFGAR
jgi:uncharacterized protein YidB (DUF937 family)